MTCPYCAKPATATIIANPHRVCAEHALEYWTGLVGYARGRSGRCVKLETWCSCPLCEELDSSRLRVAAISSVGPSPGDHVGFAMPLAS